jgi:5-methylcytosine-specific restriction endonuclease McrA
MLNLKLETVLVLNKNWQAIGVKSIADSLSMMYASTATGLDIQGTDNMIPHRWESWINLPQDISSNYISTIRGSIKIPKVIILCNYNKIPKKRPKFSSRAIWSRDNGICQYTGQQLTPSDANVDHVIPRSKGGKTDWTNCVLSHKKINSLKGDKTLEEIGLKLIRQPFEPRALPTTFFIRNKHQIPEWDIFLNYDN